MAEPPIELINACTSQWNGERASAARQNVTELADSMVVESVLCGRIWSEAANFSPATLTKNTGSLQSHLRACLAFHQLEGLEGYDWKNFGPFLRNEMISDRIATAARLKRQGQEVIPPRPLKDKLLSDWGVTKEERNTLERLNIELPPLLDDTDDEQYVGDVYVGMDNEEFWKKRDLFHVSLDHIQDVILENCKRVAERLSNADATQYFSLTISRIFDKAVLSMVSNPGNLKTKTREGIGLLHLVEEHALISASNVLGERDEVCHKIIELLGERLSEEAQGKGMDLSELRLKCSRATDEYKVAEDIPWKELKGGTETTEAQNLMPSYQELQRVEQEIIRGWGGRMSTSQSRGPRAIYIDAVKLTNQIWGEIGDRKSIKAFLRSIRITPHMNFVFGKAIRSVGASRKILHGGDDFLLTYTKHVIDKDDLVRELMGDVLEPLIGTGRWHVKDVPQKDGTVKKTWHVIGTGFARPFWWWYDGRSYDDDLDAFFIEALKDAKDDRRDWLRYATRTDIQIHPDHEFIVSGGTLRSSGPSLGSSC